MFRLSDSNFMTFIEVRIKYFLFVIQYSLVAHMILFSSAVAHAENQSADSGPNTSGAPKAPGVQDCVAALTDPHSIWSMAQNLLDQQQSSRVQALRGSFSSAQSELLKTAGSESPVDGDRLWQGLWSEQYLVLQTIDTPHDYRYKPSLDRIILFLELSLKLQERPDQLARELNELKSNCFFNNDHELDSDNRIPSDKYCLTDYGAIQILSSMREHKVTMAQVQLHITELRRRLGTSNIISERFFLAWLLFEMDPGIPNASLPGQ